MSFEKKKLNQKLLDFNSEKGSLLLIKIRMAGFKLDRSTF